MRSSAAMILLAVCLVAGCASGGLPVTHYYTLGVPGEVPARRGDGEGLRLAVESLAVATPYDQDRIVYRRGIDSTEVGFYAYHRWAAPLGRLAQAALIDGLEGTPGVGAVRTSGSSGEFDAVLGGRILHVEEIDGAVRQEVRIALELSLRRTSGEELWSATFARADPGVFSDGGAVARALHRVFEGLLADARQGLEAEAIGKVRR